MKGCHKKGQFIRGVARGGGPVRRGGRFHGNIQHMRGSKSFRFLDSSSRFSVIKTNVDREGD